MLVAISLVYTFFLSLYLFFRNAEILQKQYYELNRYYLYLKSHIKINILKMIAFILPLSLFFFKIEGDLLVSIVSSVLIITSLFLYKVKKMDTIVKFSFTARIKRLLAIYTILYTCLMAAVILFGYENCYVIPSIYYILFNVIFIISIYISKLVEAINIMKYIKRAKKKLSGNKDLKIIGITGSYGKTSTKNYIRQFLENDYKVLATKKSFNTLLGVLKTINDELLSTHEILILEFGLDRLRGLDKFIKLMKIDVGIVTSIGSQHLSTFKNIENIEKEKIKLLTKLPKSALAIINNHDDRICKYHDLINAEKITVDIDKVADVYADGMIIKSNNTTFDLHLSEKIYNVKTPILGAHQINNIILAVAVAKYFKISDDKITKKIKTLKAVPNRMELKKDGLWDVIDDSYNSNISGFIETLKVLAKSKNKKVLITPGLIELDKANYEVNYSLAINIKDSCDLVVLVGYNAVAIKKGLLDLKFESENIITVEKYIDGINYLKNNFIDTKITLLIENDLPETFLK